MNTSELFTHKRSVKTSLKRINENTKEIKLLYNLISAHNSCSQYSVQEDSTMLIHCLKDKAKALNKIAEYCDTQREYIRKPLDTFATDYNFKKPQLLEAVRQYEVTSDIDPIVQLVDALFKEIGQYL